MSSLEESEARWKAAEIASAAALGAGNDDGQSIKLDDSEVSLLLSGGPANVSNIDSSAQSIEIADYEQRSRSPEEEEFDNDYVLETPEESDPKPIQIDITKLKSAGKKRRNDYAPAERGSKKAKTTAIGKILQKKIKPEQRDGWTHLQDLRYHISKCKDETGKQLETRLNSIRSFLMKVAQHLHISEDHIKATDDGGLKEVANQREFRYPDDLVADARALLRKWGSRNFDSYLLRGVDYKSFKSTEGRRIIARKLQDNYPRKAHAYIGQGTLTNGQWWPLQICLIRDGAHGALESGISGTRGGVAHSVIVSNSGYSNIDNGETVEYCGTASKSSTPTPNTQMLLESHKQGTPVRLIRSGGNKAVQYLPSKGLRYDGLYDVTGYVVLDQATAMHRFTLSRQAGQSPIRHTGDGVRPNESELEAWEDIRKGYGLSA